MHGKWVGYHDGGTWQPIEAQFRNDGSAWVFDRGPILFHVPELATGTAVIEANNRYDIFGRQPIASSSMVFEVTPENVRPVTARVDESNSSQVWYDDAWGDGLSLRYTVWYGKAPRVTREAVIDPARCPRDRDLQASWMVRCENALTLIDGARPTNPDGTGWTGSPGDTANIPEGGAAIYAFDGHSPDPVRGSGFLGPRIWYWRDIDPITGVGELVSQPATVTATIVDASTIRLTKFVPQSLIDAAAAEGSLLITDDVQTLYPDPNVETSSVDGWVRRQDYANPGFASVVAGNGTDSDSSSANHWLQWTGSTPHTLYRNVYVFDASALPAGTVDACDFDVYQDGYNNGRSFRLTGADTASNTELSSADYQAIHDNHDTTFGTMSSSSSGTWKTISLNQAGLDHCSAGLAGHIKLSLRLTGDAQTPGSTHDGILFRFAEQNSPRLDVTYTAAAGGGVFNSRCSLSFGLSY